MVCSSDCQGAERTLTSRTCAILRDLFGQQTEVEITQGEYGAGLKRLCTLQLTLLSSPKELIFGLTDDDRDKAPSVSLLAHPKPADPQQEKCQTEEVIVACSALCRISPGWASRLRSCCSSGSFSARLGTTTEEPRCSPELSTGTPHRPERRSPGRELLV